jgi:hypothetical protein
MNVVAQTATSVQRCPLSGVGGLVISGLLKDRFLPEAGQAAGRV